MSEPTVRKRLGAKIRELRKNMGISQEELGFRAGIHPNYVGSVERGERNIAVDNTHRIAKALGVTVEELMVKAKL